MPLIPWPLGVSAGDFQPVPQSINEREVEPIGYFRYRPSEPLDVSLVDRPLASASEQSIGSTS
jgi:hypothetical protein